VAHLRVESVGIKAMPHGDQLLPDCGQRTHPEVSIKEGPNGKLLLKNLTGIGEPVYFVVAQWFPFVLVGHRLTIGFLEKRRRKFEE